MSKPIIYVVNDIGTDIFQNVVINSVSSFTEISIINCNDLILYHYGRVDSVLINKEDIQDSPNLERTICFSRKSNNPCSWDRFVLSNIILNEKGQTALNLEILEKELIAFQNNLNKNRKKTIFRLTIASFIKRDDIISLDFANKNKFSDGLFIRCFSDRAHFIKYFKKNNVELHNTIPTINQKDDYFSELLNVCKKIESKIQRHELEIIPHTIFFRPSPLLWQYLKNIKNKIYVFLICPWRAFDKFSEFRNEGFDPEHHSNIILWNPIDGITKLMSLINSITIAGPGTKRINNYIKIKNEILIDFVSSKEKIKLHELIYPITYFQHPFDNLLDDTTSEIKALLFFDNLGNNYDQHTHDTNKNSSPFDVDFLRNQQIFALRQRCSDTLESLLVLQKFDFSAIKIQIIDDKPIKDIYVGGYNLIKILNLFLGSSFNLAEYSPSIHTFEAIRNYQSIKSISSINKNLKSILASDVILTDLLYKFKTLNGRNESIQDGIKFISGLNRAIRDIKKGNVIGQNSEKHLPSIIAFSQDTNPKTITGAIKAGAKDYVFKSRPFFLPAAIIKAKLTTGDLTTTYHRNFRSVYNLNNEVIGLLQSIKIHLTNDPAVKEFEINRIEEHLNSIPKTDLHVHLGSCMSNEFLVLASFISLLRLKYQFFKDELPKLVKYFHTPTDFDISIKPRLPYFEDIITFSYSTDFWINEFASKIKNDIKFKIERIFESDLANDEVILTIKEIKSFFHKNFRIPDYLEKNILLSRIDSISNFELAFYTIKNSFNEKIELFDIVRVFILVHGSKYANASIHLSENDKNYITLFDNSGTVLSSKDYGLLNGLFYEGLYSVEGLRKSGWELNVLDNHPFRINLQTTNDSDKFKKDPIGFILATGTRASNLNEYLEGCEYSGAEHLQHPYLIHLYSRQLIYNFIKNGVCYSELRGSPSGYVNSEIGFGFTDVMNCLISAFNQAQTEVMEMFTQKINHQNSWKTFSFTSTINDQFNRIDNPFSKRLPCKVNLIITGKRHKSLHDMILEAAMAASLRRNNKSSFKNSGEFSKFSFQKTEVVGFDLAGKEEGNPPEKFIQEFSRLSKLHIPLTIHAGENASSEFIESAVLKVGARRVGHGLSLAEDKELMGRLREQNVCIELCPVGNHQTSHFEGSKGRKYPLQEYLDNGLLICINTDNPIISDTNIIKEYIKASKTMNKGLTLWEALRLVRMGFVSSFLTLQEKKYFMEIVDQHLFDFFNDSRVIDELYTLKLKHEIN